MCGPAAGTRFQRCRSGASPRNFSKALLVLSTLVQSDPLTVAPHLPQNPRYDEETRTFTGSAPRSLPCAPAPRRTGHYVCGRTGQTWPWPRSRPALRSDACAAVPVLGPLEPLPVGLVCVCERERVRERERGRERRSVPAPRPGPGGRGGPDARARRHGAVGREHLRRRRSLGIPHAVRRGLRGARPAHCSQENFSQERVLIEREKDK